MGAGILPTTIHNKKLYFLFGKENKYADTPGWSDFGGGTDNNETPMQTAIREGGEELTGFLGSDDDLKRMLKRGTYTIDGSKKYRMFLFYMPYDEALPHYYNNNQRFIQKHLDPEVIKETKIFEKAEIRWVCEDELNKMHGQFRSYFQNTVDKLIEERKKITKFMMKKYKKCSRRNVTMRRTKRRPRTRHTKRKY
jgi:8-oxo-dGTP pyrophosphatase MutT (NUDIX family)